MIQQVTASTVVTALQTKTQLDSDLKRWWDEEQAVWRQLAEDRYPVEHQAEDLWDRMPTVDSKTVARSSPIFERHLGVPLDVKLIRRGGYDTIEEMIGDLVPKMLDAVGVTGRRT